MDHEVRKSLTVLIASALFITSANLSDAGFFVVNGGDATVSHLDDSGNLTGSFNTGLGFPLNIALDRFGGIYVSDGNSRTIEKYSPSGANLGVFATLPPAFGVGAVAFDQSGTLWAGGWDSGDGSLHRFSSTGIPLGSFGHVFYNNPGVSFGPASYFQVAFEPNGNVVATDDFFGALYIFAPDGSLLQSLSLSSSSASSPIDPFGLAIDHSGNIFVGGFGNHGGQIDEYSSLGVYEKTLTSNLGGINGLVGGLAFDSHGNLYATENNGGFIEKYAPDGTDLGIFASGFSGPVGITSDVVPEPASIVLFGLGGIVLVFGIHRRRNVITA